MRNRSMRSRSAFVGALALAAISLGLIAPAAPRADPPQPQPAQADLAIRRMPQPDPIRGVCESCDVNCDSMVDAADVAPFVDLLLSPSAGCSSCAGDADGGGTVDAADIQPFLDRLLTAPVQGACCVDGQSCSITTEAACGGLWLGPDTNCQTNACAIGQLTAHRPQHGAGYFPLPKTAVADAGEEDPTRGPGIRINAPGDSDPAGEDDLIEVLVGRSQPQFDLALRRGSTALRVWTSRDKLPDTEIPFIGDRTAALPLGPGQTELTVWVEWSLAAHGDAELRLEPLTASYALDTLRFHTFRGIVLALGGEGQVPTVPVDPGQGVFVVGIALYERGYDAFLYDEDNVNASGLGAVYNEAVTAVADRLVQQVAIFGYSHGGGSTHDLSERLDIDRAGIGVFEIAVTSYVDAVGNNSDIDISQELRRPPASAYHANHHQVGTFADFFLDGGTVPGSDSIPTGQNAELAPGGAGMTHFTVDDFMPVRDFIEDELTERLTP